MDRKLCVGDIVQHFKREMIKNPTNEYLYRIVDFATHTEINADVNGAYNILRKGKQDFTCEELSSGLLTSPLRIRLS